MSDDLAGKEYWDHCWKRKDVPSGIDPELPSLNNFVNRRLHQYFCSVFAGTDTRGTKLLEIGCAASSWLPYFARQFGFEIYGLDYSRLGCEQAEQVLANEGVRGTIVCGDLFKPPGDVLESFDVVFSFGVIEHFKDTAGCVRALSRFLKPGGRIVTLIPNMVGVVGTLQRWADRRVYELHVSLDKPSLASAHEVGGLRVMRSDYLVSINLGVVNMEALRRHDLLYRVLVRLRSWTCKMIWVVETALPVMPPNRWTSPYVACCAAKLNG